ncbi:hypothetical protein Tco_0828686 [Tanacetum coccineum]
MTTKAQQIAMDNALVAPENQCVIGKCNMRINPGKKPKEPTYQVVLDALVLTTCYHAFLITAEVPVIYMHKILGQEFNEPLSEEEALSFIRELGHSGEIKYITDGMYYKKNLDFVALVWEELAYQIDNKDSKKQYKMFYPRFTKIIIHHFLKKDKSILMRNRTFMHTARDDSLLGTIRFVSRHEDTQVYGDILLKALTNQAMLDSVSYKTYYAIASGAELLKSKKSQKKSDSAISSEESPSKNKSASKPKPTKKKATVKADKGKSLNVLSEVTLSKATQLKEATKQSKKDFYISHASASGDTGEEDDDDEDDTEDESDNDDNDDGDNDDNDDDIDDERTESNRDVILNLNHTNEKQAEEEEENVDERVHTPDDYELTDEEDNANNAKEVNKEEEDDAEELYRDVNVNLRKEDVEMTDADQGGVDQHNKTEGLMQSSFVSSNFTSKLLNFENPSPNDNEIASLMDTTVRHEEPSSQTSSLYTVPIIVIPMITYVFTTTITPPPPLFNPLTQHATPTPTPTSSEATTSFLALPDISSMFKFNDRVIKVETDLSEMNQVDQEEAQAKKKEYMDLIDTSVRTIIREGVKTQLPQILPKVVSDFTTPSNYEAASSLSEFEITKILMDKMEENKSHLRADYKRELYDALVKSYNTEKDLFDTYGDVFKLKRGQDEKDKDQDPSVGSDQRTERRNSSKEAESPKDPRSKEVDDFGVQKNQEFDTGNNDEQPDNQATPKNDCITARAEKPPTLFNELMDTLIDFFAFVMNRINITNLTQELLVRPAFNLLKGTYKSLTELEYHSEEYHRGHQVIPQDYFINNDLEYLKGGSLSRQYSTSVTKTKAATYEIKWIEDMVPNLWSLVKVVYNKHAYWGTSHWGVKRQRFYGLASNRESTKDVYSRKRIIAVTKLKIMKKYDYGHLDEIEVRTEDQHLYTFKEGGFPHLRLQDIKDMLLLLFQQKLTNLMIEEHYDLNVALRMFTRRIVIQRRVEDLQLCVKSYQKKLNLTKPDTFRPDLKKRTAYTAYSDPQGVIYEDQNNRNRLMRTDKLHKFSDGTLDFVQTALHDITSGIRMEYLPKKKWSRLDKRMALVMIYNIDKILFERRLMRNLEKFVSGREYGNDLRLLEWTI